MASEAALSEAGRELFASTLATTASLPNLEAIVRRCKASGESYTDPDFPPDSKSLIKDWGTSTRARVWQRYVWRRAIEFMDRSEMAVFKAIKPNDIQQGSMGDCYFLSALSVLAEHGDRMAKLFAYDRISEFGVYGVYVNKNGAWTTVIVDDYFPCLGPSAGPAFSKSPGAELWVLLLEKAWAKLHGSYDKIEQGSLKHVLRDLTGAPCTTFATDDPNVWEKLQDVEYKKFLAAASAGNTKGSQQLLEQMGLIGQYSYAILDTQAATTPRGSFRLIKLRNPWGNCEWTGDWGDASDLWTEELRRRLKVKKPDNGAFWMSVEDFTKYFSVVTVCMASDDYVDSWIVRNEPTGQCSMISMVVEQRSQLYLSLNQVDKQTNPNPDYAYSDAKFVVARKVQGGLEFVLGKQSTAGGERNLWAGAVFTPGEYVVSVDIAWNPGSVNEFSFSSYGESAPVFAPMDDEIPDFLQQVYAPLAPRLGKKSDYSAHGASQAFRYSAIQPEGYGFFHYQNTSDKAIKEVVTFKKLTGLKLLPPYSGNRFEISMQPGESVTVVLKQVDHKAFDMSFAATVTLIPALVTLEMLARKGVAAKRKDPSTKLELEIYVYTYQHANGISYLYENKTENRRLEETITFRLTGLQIVGGSSDSVKIELDPGQSRLLELRAVAPEWTIQTRVSYTIS